MSIVDEYHVISGVMHTFPPQKNSSQILGAHYTCIGKKFLDVLELRQTPTMCEER